MALYRSPLTVMLWPSSFLKKYGPMIPPAYKAHQTVGWVHITHEYIAHIIIIPPGMYPANFSFGRQGLLWKSGIHHKVLVNLPEDVV
ncbi:hypothetical protein TNCV_1862921 [Trichonephila clavipes]|nr:hypothetical protein TNCV_1862921 [Trichonephila clavipes]